MHNSLKLRMSCWCVIFHTQHDVRSMATFENSKTTPRVSPRTTTEGQATATPARSRAPACTKPHAQIGYCQVVRCRVRCSVLAVPQDSFGASRSSQDAYTAECQQLDPRPQPGKANAADQALEETVDRVSYSTPSN